MNRELGSRVAASILESGSNAMSRSPVAKLREGTRDWRKRRPQHAFGRDARGIRPADLVPATDSSAVRLPLLVDVVEPGGDNIVIHGRVGETPLTAKWSDVVAKSGDVEMITYSEDRLHLFDVNTGLSLLG